MNTESKIINSFPGYECVQNAKGEWENHYRGTDVGRGGYVYGETGMYYNVAMLDVGNMHGASIIALNKWGKHTKNFIELRNARMAIKAHDFERARTMLGGKLAKYLTDEKEADALQNAIKLILNSSYGIAAANFKNPLADIRDKNNIIALRGALFMRTLQDEIEEHGGHIIAIRTDSCKIPNATPELISWVIDFGRKYGYEFEHECTYDRMCLVNNSVYIAKYDEYGIRNKGGKKAGQWTATGAQFQQPFVFKTLFSKEPIIFEDMCETKTVKAAMYLDFNENLPEDEHNYKFVGRVGRFTPMVDGCNAAQLMVFRNQKYDAVTDTKDTRWMESDIVKEMHLEDKINKDYYRKKCDEAIDDISKYGDFDEFVNGPSKPLFVNELPLDFMNIPEGVGENEGIPY